MVLFRVNLLFIIVIHGLCYAELAREEASVMEPL